MDFFDIMFGTISYLNPIKMLLFIILSGNKPT